MSGKITEEIKDREERFANNDLWNHGGGAIENTHQSAPRDTSIEACEEWRKQTNSELRSRQFIKTQKLARQPIKKIANYCLPDIDILPMPEDLINASKSMPNYQLKNCLEDFIADKNACRITIDQCNAWESQINDAESEENHEVHIALEPPTGGSKNWILHGAQMQKFKKETSEQRAIVEELQKNYYDKLIPAFEQELKERNNSEKVKEILAEGEKIVKQHTRLAQEVTKALEEFAEVQSVKSAKKFIEGREKLRIMENDLCSTLRHRLDFYRTSPETTLPTLATVTSDRLQYRNGSAKGAVIKKLEVFYKKEIEHMEANNKA